MKRLISTSCILLVLGFVLNCTEGTAAPSISASELKQLEANAIQAKEALNSCGIIPKDQRKIMESVSKGMIAEVTSNSTQKNCGSSASDLSQFIQSFSGPLQALKSNSNQKCESDFIQALRLQALKNATMTYLDAIYRYHLDSPKPQKLVRVADAVNLICDNADPAPALSQQKTYSGGRYSTKGVSWAHDTCSPEEHQALAATANQYYQDLNQNKVQVLTVNQAQAQLNQKLKILNDDYGKYKKSTGTNEAEWRNIDTNIRTYKQQYLDTTRDGVGLLLYTRALKANISTDPQQFKKVTDPQVIRAGVAELKSEALQLAWNTNTQLENYKSKSVVGDSIKEMLRTNPIAAGQLLAHHPELAGVVCKYVALIAADDERDQNIKATLGNVSTAAMIVGGVLLASGIGSPAGVAVEGASSGLAAVASGVEAGLAYTALVGGSGYTVFVRAPELQKEVTQGRQGLIAKTNDNINQFKADQAENNQQAIELAKNALMIVAPGVIGATLKSGMKLMRASEALKDTEFAGFIEKTTQELKSPTAQMNLKAIDYACMAVGALYCQILAGSIRSMSAEERNQLLSDPEKFKNFLKKEKEKYKKIESSTIESKFEKKIEAPLKPGEKIVDSKIDMKSPIQDQGAFGNCHSYQICRVISEKVPGVPLDPLVLGAVKQYDLTMKALFTAQNKTWHTVLERSEIVGNAIEDALSGGNNQADLMRLSQWSGFRLDAQKLPLFDSPTGRKTIQDPEIQQQFKAELKGIFDENVGFDFTGSRFRAVQDLFKKYYGTPMTDQLVSKATYRNARVSVVQYQKGSLDQRFDDPQISYEYRIVPKVKLVNKTTSLKVESPVELQKYLSDRLSIYESNFGSFNDKLPEIKDRSVKMIERALRSEINSTLKKIETSQSKTNIIEKPKPITEVEVVGYQEIKTPIVTQGVVVNSKGLNDFLIEHIDLKKEPLGINFWNWSPEMRAAANKGSFENFVAPKVNPSPEITGHGMTIDEVVYKELPDHSKIVTDVYISNSWGTGSGIKGKIKMPIQVLKTLNFKINQIELDLKK